MWRVPGEVGEQGEDREQPVGGEWKGIIVVELGLVAAYLGATYSNETF